jgi:hypothetical protein
MRVNAISGALYRHSVEQKEDIMSQRYTLADVNQGVFCEGICDGFVRQATAVPSPPHY